MHIKVFVEIPYSSIWIFSFNDVEYVAFYVTVILIILFVKYRILKCPLIIAIGF